MRINRATDFYVCVAHNSATSCLQVIHKPVIAYSMIRAYSRSALRVLWKRRHQVARAVRGCMSALAWVYHKLPLPQSARHLIKDVAFLSLEHFIIRTPTYQQWVRSRGSGSRIQALLTPGHFGGKAAERVLAKAPDDAAWQRLEAHTASDTPLVDVVIPSYGAYDDTLNSLYHALQAAPLCATPHEIIVINDAGPDAALSEKLRELAKRGLFTLLENEQNLGFVATVNRGMQLHPDRDVVLLNSDTEVYNNWLDRLRAQAYQYTNCSSVTPFSNNAEICSYPYYVQDNIATLEVPHAEVDALAAQVNAGRNVQMPTAVGFCMYITRHSLDDVGYFDVERFGKGYGEENDFCLRASAKGYVHLLAGDCYVRHLGGSSFGASKLKRIKRATRIIDELYPHYAPQVRQFVEQDPPQELRKRLDLARLARYCGAQNMLMVSHHLGGGTEKHVRDMIHHLQAENIGAFMLKPAPVLEGVVCLSHPSVPHTPSLLYSLDMDRDVLFADVLQLGIGHLHVHHLIGFPARMMDFLQLMLAQLDLAYDVTLHDYFTICPRINLVDANNRYCGEPDLAGCERCVQQTPSHSGGVPVWQWRMQYHHLLASARAVFVPDADMAERMLRYYPDIAFYVRPHPDALLCEEPLASTVQSGVRTIVIIGAIASIKGSDVVVRLAKDAVLRNLPVEYVLIGHSDHPEILSGLDKLHVTGEYQEHELPALLAQYQPHLVLIPTLIPETYGYTLSAAYRHGIPPVVFDIGAQAARIRQYGGGHIMPLVWAEDAAQMHAFLLDIALSSPPLVQAVEYRPFMEAYYALSA